MKKFLILIGIILAMGVLIAFTWPLFPIWIGNFAGQCIALFSNKSFWITLGICVGVISFLVLFINLLLPILMFCFKKTHIYISLFLLCISKRYKISLIKTKKSSNGGNIGRGNIRISATNGTINIYFLDLIFSSKYMITFPNACEYVITSIAPSKVSKIGGGVPVGNMSGQATFAIAVTEHKPIKNKDKVRKLPDLKKNEKEINILLIPSCPTHVNVIESGETIKIGNGVRIGNLTYYSFDALKKGFQNKLHQSMFVNL